MRPPKGPRVAADQSCMADEPCSPDSLAPIPALPGYFPRLNRLLGEEPLDLESLAARLEENPGLARRVQRAAARAAHGRQSPSGAAEVGRLEDAILLLGGDALRVVVWNSALRGWLQKELRPELWTRWRRIGRLCRSLAKANDYPRPHRAYLAGLTHDLGLAPLLAKACRADREAAFLASERQRWGFDHCRMGGWLGHLWNFPADIIEVMECHHAPQHARLDPLLVHLVAAAVELECGTAMVAG